MIYTKCPNCGVELEVTDNNIYPGGKETEEYYCPKCGALAGKVRTSGIPWVNVRK